MVTTSSRHSMTHDTYTRIFGSPHMTPFMLVLVLSFCLIWYVIVLSSPCLLSFVLLSDFLLLALPRTAFLLFYDVIPLFSIWFSSCSYCSFIGSISCAALG